MAGERIRLEVSVRTTGGSAESRRLRKQGFIPGVLYGRGNDPHAIAIPERELRRALSGSGGLHAILDVVLGGDGGKAHPSVLKDYQLDPLRGGLAHVDLQEVRLDRPIQAQVVVSLVGEAAGSKEGGVLQQATREVTVEALPMEIPEHLDLDVSELHIGDSLRVADLPPREGVAFLDDPDTVIASVTQPTRVEEPEEVTEEGEEGAEGVPEGEQAPESASEPAGEPDAAAAGGEGTVPG